MKSFLKLAIIFIYYLFVSSNDAELKNDKIEIVIEFKNNHISKTEIHEIENRFDVKYKKLLFDNFHVIQKWINTFEHNAEHEYNKTDFVQKLKNYENIESFHIQKKLIRKKRGLISDMIERFSFHVDKINQPIVEQKKCSLSKYHFNDPFWSYQWYMNDGCDEGKNLNITSAWDLGFTGKNVVVSIIDDGVENTNPDLRDNYDPKASIDLNDGDYDPKPRYEIKNENKHGTRCAGEISASANNSVCGVGIAYNSRIGGIRLLDGRINDRIEAAALSFNINYIDIFSASWGPLDNGKTVEGPGKLSSLAFLKGINEGRGKKGVIYVWASGNGGKFYDNCNCDGYTASIYTITISSVTQQHSAPKYSEKCASILASTYSSGKNINSIVTSDLRNTCTKSHSGTSASAPIAAGIISLVLEANRNLTWRDVQYLIVYTSDNSKLQSSNWGVNGRGRRFCHEFGFGLMNAGKMVDLAMKWTNVEKQLVCSINILNKEVKIESDENKEIKVKIDVSDACDKKINSLEHVQSYLSIDAIIRGHLHITLISPSGTISNLLDYRPFDQNKNGFHNWPFMTAHYWGENPNGEWILIINNRYRKPAYLFNWTLVIYGVENFNQRLTV
jgi:furin